jgi:phi13 family phage major tail protein
MAQKKNVYKFGLSKLIIAKRTVSGGTGSYSDAFQCGEAQTATVTPNFVSGSVYGDDKKVAEVSEFKDAAIQLGSTTMPASATGILFGHQIGVDGVETSKASDVANDVGLGFTSKNHDGSYDACVIFRARFSEGAENYQTKGDGINFVFPSLSGSIMAREEDDKWRVKNFDFASESAAVDWICTILGITNTFTNTKYTVTQNLSHATSSFSGADVDKASSLTITLTADTGYELATPTVIMGNVYQDPTDVWDSATGKITIASVDGDLIITETATVE